MKTAVGRDLAARISLLAVFSIIIVMFSVAPPAAGAAAASDVDAVEPVVSEVGFTHPGVFDSLESLKVTKQHVRAGDAPWADSFKKLASSEYVSRTAPDFTSFASAKAPDAQKTPEPQKTSGAQKKQQKQQECSVKDAGGCITVCGSFNDNPSVGCDDQRADSRAVNAQALMYWYTGDEKYARRAVAILNAYAKHFKGNTGSNGPLMTAWTAGQMVRGAELIRYTYTPSSSKDEFDVDGFSTMLRKVLVPTLTTFDYGRYNGNWKLSAAEGLMNIGVFLDDRKLYNQAMAMWRERVPAYVYLSTDGDLPTKPANDAKTYQTPIDLSCQWLAGRSDACQTDPREDPNIRFQNGQNQESCRDFGHAAMGLGGIINTAETAWIQGDDLYGEQQKRIITGVLHAVQISQNFPSRGWPAGFCAGAEELSENLSLAELPVNTVYNAYAIRKGVEMPAISIPGYPSPTADSDPLREFMDSKKRNHGYVGNVTAWDTLTHHLASVPYSPRKVTATPTPTPATSSAPPRAAADSGIDLLQVGTSIFAIIGVIATGMLLFRLGKRSAQRKPE